MKYSQTKLNRAVASLKIRAQATISDDGFVGEIDKVVAEEIMIVLDRLSKLETLVNQHPNKPLVTKLEDVR